MTITLLPVSEQPREKLLNKGPESLSDAELLAIFLRTGFKGCSAVELARRMINEFGSLQALFDASLETFCQSKGLGSVKYCQLQAVLEMAKRYFWEELQAKPSLTSSKEAQEFIYSKLQGLHREVFGCIFLNNQHHVISYETLFSGTINQAAVYPREIAKKCLEVNAAAVILAHNHPSGMSDPSQADKKMTDKIVKALSLLDVKVLDHFIVGKRNVYSFAESGIL